MKLLNVICCSVLRREMEEVLRQEYPQARAIFLDSMLHMRPRKLQQALERTLCGLPSRTCLLIYGDCHPFMQDMERQYHCCRTAGINCSDLLLGRELYAQYRKEGAFFFLPEWTARWREVFQKELGFTTPSLAKEFMQENRGKLIYLDTGLLPVPEQTLGEISTYFGMPVDVLPVSLALLHAAVRSAMRCLEGKSPDES